MSTRAVYGFRDEYSTWWVYVHCDGYPSGAAEKFEVTLKSGKVWPGTRFEADEFASGFVAANKNGAGDVRLSGGPDSHGDIEYVYMFDGAKLTARTAGGKHIFSGPLADFIRAPEKAQS